MNIYIGVDLHKAQFTCYVKNEFGKARLFKFLTDEKGYNRFLKLLDILKNKEKFKVSIAVESTGNTRYFKQKIENEIGIETKVINTMKFKVINESINKTDKRDAKTIADFLEKDMLPEAKICSVKSEQLKRITKSRSILVSTRIKIKNQIHGILLSIGITTKTGQFNSKIGRKKVIEIVKDISNKKLIQSLVNVLENTEDSIKELEKEMEDMTDDDRVVEILKTIPGTGKISAITVRAHIDDIARFSSSKKLSSYVGLVPWVRQSDKKEYIGHITKRGSKELRTAIVQMVMGMIRSKSEKDNIFMNQYNYLKTKKATGIAIIAVARRLTKLIWTLLTKNEEYNPLVSSSIEIIKKAESMRHQAEMNVA